ncbi:MAG: sigma-70 family RNA polymerase sigma factor [Blastocatellia bacterium]|nr:sigma-70 family RNA polymerase sigma factor [Blastocatellia bacterium]
MDDSSIQNTFDAMLRLFDADREVAAVKYESLRVRLIAFFEWRGCVNAEDLTDICFDRLQKKVSTGEEIENANAYTATIAQFVYREHLRSPDHRSDSFDDENEAIPEPEMVVAEKSEDGDLECLDDCLNEFSPNDRQLMIEYYNTDERTMIASRKRMADAMACTLNTLRIKVCRMKSKLEVCVRDCCKRTGKCEG